MKFRKEYHPHLKICPSEIIFISFFVRSRKRKKKDIDAFNARMKEADEAYSLAQKARDERKKKGS